MFLEQFQLGITDMCASISYAVITPLTGLIAYRFLPTTAVVRVGLVIFVGACLCAIFLVRFAARSSFSQRY